MSSQVRVLGATAVIASCALAAPAALADNANQFDLPAQALEASLRAVGKSTGTNILIDRELVRNHRAPALKAWLTVDEALARLLLGSGLRHRFVDERTVVLSPIAENIDASRSSTDRSRSGGYSVTTLMLALLTPFTVSAADREAPVVDANGEVIETINVFGTLDNQLSIGSKSGQSLRETPKSVTIVTRERIEAQNLTSMAEALSQTTGVSIAPNTPVNNGYTSRGFNVTTVQLDGGAPAYTGSFGAYLSPDTAAYDHVEMLRGVDGMYTGANEPGGVINLVRKRAKATPALQSVFSGGRWDFYRGEVDATGALTDDGRLRGRIVGAYEDKNYFYDRGESKKTLFFGTAEYDLTPSTLLIAGASYERRKEDGHFIQGHARYTDGSDLKLPRETSFAPEWNHWYSTLKEVFARVEQSFGDTGVIKFNATRLEQDINYRYLYAFGAVNPVTQTGTRALSYGIDSNSVQDLLDLSVNGTFALFGGEHRYTVGADYADLDGGKQKDYMLNGYTFADARPIDVFNFDPSQYPQTPATLAYYYPERTQTQHGFYGTVGLQLAEPLRLTLGGRYSEFRYLQVFQTVTPSGTYNPASTTRYDDSKFIPSVALSWDFARDWSAYASYAETFKVQANRLRGPMPGGTPLDPITGDGWELGVKGEVFGVLNTALALYRIERDGQAVLDQRYGFIPGENGSSCCYLPQVNMTSEGVDAEVSGTVLPGWQMFAGYTFNRSEYEGADALLFEGRYFTTTPRNMFKMWTTWQLPGEYSRWTLNAGVTAQSSTYINGVTAGAPYRVSQDGYSVWNASVQYRLNDTWTVGLYGDNLFDETYYSVVGTADSNNVYGRPRSYVLTVRGNW